MSCSPCVLARLARCSARIEGLAAEDRQAAIDRATALVRDRVRPAYERVLALMNELHPRTTADAGLWRLPQGDKAYAQALANYTTTTLDADAIHALGLREVARIEGRAGASGASSALAARTAKAGRCMPSAWRWTTAGTQATRVRPLACGSMHRSVHGPALQGERV